MASMTTIVEFKAKQATGRRYRHTNKFYTNFFFYQNLFELSGACQKLGAILEIRPFKNKDN